MKLGFVAGLLDTETDWVTNTARKFSEHTGDIVVEFHQEHGWLKNLKMQAAGKAEAEKRLKEFCDPKFGLHVPWEPRKSYRAIDRNFNDKDVLRWLNFAADNEIEFANMHVEWGDGVKASEWVGDPAARDGYVENAAENLKNVFSFAEASGIKLSLETLPSCLFVEKFGSEYVNYPAFPDDYLKLRKISGFEFGINPDVCHASITWHNLQNGVEQGIYPEDAAWKNLSLEKFLERFIQKSGPIHQAHVADFLGYRIPSQHAVALGSGMLTDNAIKSVIRSVGKKAALVLEIREDWGTKRGIRKSGFLPETVKSLEKISEFI